MDFGVREKAILADSLITVFVAYAFLNYLFGFVSHIDFGKVTNFFLYYTNWSNILAVVAAAASIHCILKGIRIPKALAVFKLAAVFMLTVTMLVVAFVLVPQIGWQVLLDPGGMIFLHLFVPLLTIAEFLFLSDMDALDRRDVLCSIIPTLIYGLGVIAVLIVAGNDDLAPYPFFRIHSQPVYATVLWIVGLALLSLGVSYGHSRLLMRTNPAVRAAVSR